MRIGVVGLGKMGANIARRLLGGGHDVIGFDRDQAAAETVAAQGVRVVDSLETLVQSLDPARIIWLAVPAGEATTATLEAVGALLDEGDTLVDGGNTMYKDSMAHAASLRERGIDLLDVGTSGGIWGLEKGYSLMIGGSAAVVERLRPVFETLAPAPDRGWGHVGPSGAGHFTKMIHNGIEYGAMQAYAEGFALMERKREFDLDLHQVAEIWRSGSVVRSWLLELISSLLSEDPSLAGAEVDVRPTPIEITATIMDRLRADGSIPVGA